MDFSKQYQEKLISADEAAKLVKNGDWLDYGWCTGTVDAFDKALAKRVDELEEVYIRGGVLLKMPEILKADPEGKHFIWNSWHSTGLERKLINNKTAFYIPLRYSEMPRWYRENIKKINIVAMQVAPMDKFGYFNFGPNASHMKAAIECADRVIVEVNEKMPRVLGGFESAVHIRDVDFIIEGENPELAELPSGSFGPDDEKVAEYIVDELVDGSCLQLGIGAMPNAVGSLIARSDLKNLGVHTEMYVDGFVELSKQNKITGACKSIDKNRQVMAFGAGSKEMYEYINDNPEIMSAPVNYTNDVNVIGSIDNFMSINTAVEVDLFGQVSAESQGVRHISGAGGQLDFVLGAYRSNGGKSFIALKSAYTNKKTGKKVTNIRPTLKEGSIVTDTRANTMYIVTEYGIANLKGLATWQRAEALIDIAHPDFRDELIKEAEEIGIWRKSNKR
ncbi:MAG: butyryl-CoA:acetate CoA-transferase [Tissierellia bacterium]|nr:butyryl-CoA:acetate CoA-transferase [Tissierellia bacterium]